MHTFQIVKGNLVNSWLESSSEFSLRFNITPYRAIPGYANIIHVTETGKNTGPGGRMPGVWFNPESTRLHVCVYCMGHINPNLCINLDDDIPSYKKTHVNIQLSKRAGDAPHIYILSIDIDHVLVKYEECNNPYRASARATIYHGNPWHTAAEAWLEDVVYQDIARRRREVVQELPVPFPEA